MLKVILCFLLVIYGYQFCSPAPGWKPATIEESFNLSGAVLFGVVSAHMRIDPNSPETMVELTNVLYFKGCGPETVIIKGITNSAMCGVDPPNPGSQVLIFGCPLFNNYWKIHDFTIHAGLFQATGENLGKLFALTPPKFCYQDEVSGDDCKPRPEIGRPPVPPPYIKPSYPEPPYPEPPYPFPNNNFRPNLPRPPMPPFSANQRYSRRG